MPVSFEMVEEYDTFCKDFRRCVYENQDQGNLDLGECHTYLSMLVSLLNLRSDACNMAVQLHVVCSEPPMTRRNRSYTYFKTLVTA